MLQSALFRQRLVTFTVTQDILSNHGGARDLSNQTQLWGGAYFPDLAPGQPCCFRFPPRLVPDLLALRSSGKSHTEADARHQGECSLWGTRGSWPVSVLISLAVPGADGAGLDTCAGLSSPPISLHSGSCLCSAWPCSWLHLLRLLK